MFETVHRLISSGHYYMPFSMRHPSQLSRRGQIYHWRRETNSLETANSSRRRDSENFLPAATTNV